jgi:hypothetical protein
VRNFDVNVECATWNLRTNSAFAIGLRKTTYNLDEVGRSHESPGAD